MKTKTLPVIIKKLLQVRFVEKYNLVVGITRGGVVPAYLISSHLDLPLEYIWINFRNGSHKPKYHQPQLIKPINFSVKNKKIIIVDDRLNSGATMKLAKKLLSDARKIDTLVVNGEADYSLFNEDCFLMPWDLNF